ncbi:NAC domain-containing protein 105-like protein [Cucumis melo var. makuwa]|uniref:NAC domain-containing protein 105-like protein n=1 Tax=Cucumis melo var. makuwa TaxID=1194695 RepID=A0A5A7TSB0_CUCMM|nr:NAC domain-containing protein 105-like protein [Cucumis melo var. makuwa]TYK25028.1 NAC domain-containing protein 105-like protein [Cucumis melo var. makuwa]
MDPSMLPLGFTFCPTDEELLGYYLFNKVLGEQAPLLELPVIDLYIHEPSEIWQKCGGVDKQDVYFFTTLKKKKSRIIRKVGSNGNTWSCENRARQVFSSTIDHLLLGSVKRFHYQKPKAKDCTDINDCTWIMYEYTLDPSIVPKGLVHDSYVLYDQTHKHRRLEENDVVDLQKEYCCIDAPIECPTTTQMESCNQGLSNDDHLIFAKEIEMEIERCNHVELSNVEDGLIMTRLEEKDVVDLQKECCIDVAIGCPIELCRQDLSNDDDLIFAKAIENEIERYNNMEQSNVEDGSNYDNEWYFR